MVEQKTTMKLNHEKIKELQRKRAEKYSDKLPSQVYDVYFIYAINNAKKYPKATERSGKWLIFANVKELDEVWIKIKNATEQGLLGGSSKVATMKPNPNATSTDTKVICVYTYDWTDEKDVTRIREELRKLGITNKIPYKADEDTVDGKYVVTGHKNISKYYY